MRYVQVVIENKSRHTDSFFTYRYDEPDESEEKSECEIKIGEKVIVPFGRGSKLKEGYVFGFTETLDCPEEKLKSIERVEKDGSLNEEIMKTASWMKKRYAITYAQAVKCFVPGGKPPKPGKEKEPYKNIKGDYTKPKSLTKEQKRAVNTINGAIRTGFHQIFLLHGVTASGKTQVYMEAAAECLSQGKSAIILVPEIGLTNQLIQRFAGRFGKEQIAIMHSKLTPRERYDEWQRMRQGKARIVIGARMGVFAPLSDIGLIVLDEEHEATYKSDMTPKYDTVEVAAKRLQYAGGVMILGSATPSVTSYERCREGIYQLIELKERYNKTPLPEVKIVDMRKELHEGNASIFSRSLYEAIKDKLEKKQQIILFQNRRGYSNFVSCRECGKVMRCPECDISLVYHKNSQSMICHYCGKRYPVPKICPECGSRYIKYFGVGTEQVEEAAGDFFPEARLARLDLDSAMNRKDLDQIIQDFSQKKTDILVGTQLVAKGLDFDNVGLVGVIAGDVTLNIPDYRSAERTFQLITQVAGRAGRGDEQGLVIVQTYDPDNYAFQMAKNHDYNGFFEEEIKLRNFMEYPPFGDIIMVNFTAESEEEALAVACRCQSYMEKASAEDGPGRVLSPKVALNFKGKESFRQYIIIKSRKGSRNKNVFYLENFQDILLKENSKVTMNVDVNPYSIV